MGRWAICPAADEITQPYGCVPNPGEWQGQGCNQGWGFHAGIDLGAVAGGASIFRTPVIATRSGVIVAMQDPHQYLGNQAVCIHTDDGVYIEHGHLDVALVQPGEHVQVGRTIGLLGTRGASSAPHLHVEVHTDGPFQEGAAGTLDPTPYLQEDAMTDSEKDGWTRTAFIVGTGRQPTVDDLLNFRKAYADDRSNIADVVNSIYDSPEGQAWRAKLQASGASAALPASFDATINIKR